MATSKLTIKFTDESNSFATGVEYGRLLQKIEQGDETINNNGFPVKISNKEVLVSTCKEHGYTAIFGQEYYDEWVEFMAIKNVSFEN